jgi:hypothetical protein
VRIRTLETTSTVYLEWFHQKHEYTLEILIGDKALPLAYIYETLDGFYRLCSNVEWFEPLNENEDFATHEEPMAIAETAVLAHYGLEVAAVGKDALSAHLAKAGKCTT